jgi:hypothetical protein
MIDSRMTPTRLLPSLAPSPDRVTEEPISSFAASGEFVRRAAPCAKIQSTHHFVTVPLVLSVTSIEKNAYGKGGRICVIGDVMTPVRVTYRHTPSNIAAHELSGWPGKGWSP